MKQGKVTHSKELIGCWTFELKVCSIGGRPRGFWQRQVAWWKLGNFIVRYIKFNSCWHVNEQLQRIFWCILRQIWSEPSKIGNFLCSNKIVQFKNQLILPVNLFWKSPWFTDLAVSLSLVFSLISLKSLAVYSPLALVFSLQLLACFKVFAI